MMTCIQPKIGVFALVVLSAASGSRAVENTWEYSVQASASIQLTPPQVFLSWPQDVNGQPLSYAVYRKSRDATNWGSGVFLPGTATNYLDTNVLAGLAYEYKIRKTAIGYNGYGYVYVGLNAPMIDARGKLILMVDDAFTSSLSNEISRLEQDLVGDGWIVLRHEVARQDSVPRVKALIQADYASDPANVRCVFLLGHIPVPYSGDMAPDDHTEDTGAWPADLYYGDMNGTWTDSTVNDVSGETPRRWNVPGDGKFDQTLMPSPVELEVGRVDLANMPGRKEWMGPPTFPNELELLRNYLNKDHAFRHKLYTAEARGLVFDGAGAREGAAFAANGWRNFAPFFGASQIRTAFENEFLPILQQDSYLWSYACGGADSHNIAYLGGTGNFNGGTTTDFVERDVKTVFTMLFGSHLGDWDVEDNLMRSVLATPTYGLACAYGGAPHWFFHHMALGETIGYSTRLTQNNPTNGIYSNDFNQSVGQVHVALMGDPTLRLQPVAPPSQPIASIVAAGIQLNWSPSLEPVAGYHIYRAATPAGPFERLSQTLITETRFLDGTNSSGIYMVRAVKLQSSASGTYFNPSQGVFTIAAAPSDSDGDGMTDSDEAFAGTDPHDAASVLTILSVQCPSNSLSFFWSSIPGKTYRLAQRSVSPGESWSDVGNDIPSQGAVTSTIIPAPASPRLYTVRVLP